MKNLLLVIAAAIMFASCEKQASNQPAKISMTAEELKAKYAIELPGIDYSNSTARNNKPKANAVTVVVWENDLTLSESSGLLTTTISPNAQWAGVQKFIDISTVDGAVSLCNWFYWAPPGPAATKTCNANGSGFYRSWCSDFDYNVHISNVVQL